MTSRQIACVLGLVLALAFVVPASADDGVSPESLWSDLVQWVTDLVTPEPQSDPEPDPAPGDEHPGMADPNG